VHFACFVWVASSMRKLRDDVFTACLFSYVVFVSFSFYLPFFLLLVDFFSLVNEWLGWTVLNVMLALTFFHIVIV
jgi:hypothetical protein